MTPKSSKIDVNTPQNLRNRLRTVCSVELMGVLNITPDSFSDGGEFLDPDAGVHQGKKLIGEGAAILDIGGESTRPGAQPVSAEVEIARVVPVIEGLAPQAGASEVMISIDTSKLEVGEAALNAGAGIVNDVTALRQAPELGSLTADRGASLILMHMQGEPRTMQLDPVFDDVVSDVKAFLAERLAFAVSEGVLEEKIWLDPGIGFGKSLEHNLELIRRLHELTDLGRPLIVGTSRKSFIGKIDGSLASGRIGGSVASNVEAWRSGASILRVHDVAAIGQGILVADAIRG